MGNQGIEKFIDEPLCMDCFDLLAQLPDGCVNLVFADPPYNIGVFKKMPADEYLEWCEQWIAECSRGLAANGAFWVSHSKPDVLVDISRIIEQYGRGRRNWVTWDKYNGASTGQQYIMNRTKLHPQGKRSFDQDAEYLTHHSLKGFLDGFTLTGTVRSFQPMVKHLVWHADEGNWTRQCDKERGFIFEPLRAYLDGERQRAGIDKIACNVACGFSATAGGMASRHYFSRSQWCLPTPEHYKALRQLFNRDNGDKYLRREYEDLRREYEHLRYTFNNPGKVSSVWQIPPAPRNGHPTPKPEALLERIILATSNENDLILDPFAGSFTTAVVAQHLNRHWICCDIEQNYVDLGKERLSTLCQLSLTSYSQPATDSTT